MSSYDDSANDTAAASLRIRVGTTALTADPVRSSEQLLNDAISNHPTDLRLRYNLALLLCQTGRFDEAQPQFDRLIQQSQDSRWAWKARTLKACVLAEQKRWEAAKDALCLSDEGSRLPANELPALGKAILGLALIHIGQDEEFWNFSYEDPDLQWPLTNKDENKRDPAGTFAQESHDSCQLALAVLARTALGHVKEQNFKRASFLFAKGLAKLNVHANTIFAKKKFASMVALTCVLGGQREFGRLLWDELQRRDRGSLDVSHSLFVSDLAEAQSHDMNGRESAAAEAWRRVIRNGVYLTYCQSYWAAFSDQRRVVYQPERDSNSSFDLRPALEQMVSRCLPADSPLGIVFSLELASAAAMKSLGGLPVADLDPEKRIVCGVEMLRQLRLTANFGDYIDHLCDRQSTRQDTIKIMASSLKREDGSITVFALPTVEEIRRKARYFSRFGEAQRLVEQGYPQRALIVLAQLGTMADELTNDVGLTDDTFSRETCDDECKSFNATEPHPGLTASFPCLWHDATELAREAYLAAVDIESTKVPLNADVITEHWRAAVRLSNKDSQLELQKNIANRTLQLANALGEEKRFDDQIALVDAAAQVCGQEMRPMLEASLARCLNLRGVARTKLVEPDWKSALDDFNRAVSLNPYVSVRIMNLIIALRQRALDVYESDVRQAAKFLLQAKQEITTRLKDLAYGPEMRALGERIKNDAEEISAILKSESVVRAASGDHAGELDDLRLATELVASGEAVPSRIKICRPTDEREETPVPQLRVRILETTTDAPVKGST